jgi:hypothetical protein
LLELENAEKPTDQFNSYQAPITITAILNPRLKSLVNDLESNKKELPQPVYFSFAGRYSQVNLHVYKCEYGLAEQTWLYPDQEEFHHEDSHSTTE